MYYLNNEKSIISHFQLEESESIYFPIESEDAIEIFESIHNTDKWTKWKYSAGKGDPPPDFYSDDYLCMMEVMRVDDHSYKNKKGKIVNPTNMHISEVEKEISQSGIIEMIPNAELVINAVTDLPTEQDHNYTFYYKSFARVIEDHKKRINLYRINHPNYKIIFFIMDESSAYFKAENLNDIEEERRVREVISGYPHLHFMDKKFISVFENSEIDYLIWYTPFKLTNTTVGRLDLPKACVFDVKKLLGEYREYDARHMISTEI